MKRCEKKVKLTHYGIRIDSGDLAYLSKEAYKMLAAAGFDDATISASSDLDEYLIDSLKTQDAKINSWGVGTNLITSKDNPAFGGVYKLAAVKRFRKLYFYTKDQAFENTEKSPILEIKLFIESTVNPQARSKQILSVWQMKFLIRKKL